jgi:cell division protein ZapA
MEPTREDKAVLTLKILGKEYTIGCATHHQLALQHSALYLDAKMKDIRDQHHVVGLDRIAVMAALHIAHELLTVHHERDLYIQHTQGKIQEFEARIERALDASLMQQPSEALVK